nr:protein kinase-like domain, phloem protein 2-like protein [Tanacetum cinerariifolium]
MGCSYAGAARIDITCFDWWRSNIRGCCLPLLASFSHAVRFGDSALCPDFEIGREMMLVYEDATNGSPDDHMQKNNSMASLFWDRCLQICFDTGESWSYFRENILKVIHRDIRSAKIVLDDIWNGEDC